MEALEIVTLTKGEITKTTRIGTALSPEMRTRLVQFLKENLEDMLGISPEVIQHTLNVNSKKKPVQQRRRIFTLERDQVVIEEVSKLLTAGFIREVYYLDWLATSS